MVKNVDKNNVVYKNYMSKKQELRERDKFFKREKKSEKMFWKPKTKEVVKFLETLETQFPEWVFPLDVKVKYFFIDRVNPPKKSVVKLLFENKLIEIQGDLSRDIDNTVELPFYKYKITNLGLRFLENMRIRKLNKWLVILTVGLILLGIIQTIILLFK